MITELHIENLGVIEHASVRLGLGLTALTGETGAGKTMLVEALELLAGGRADTSMVRRGAAEARIDGRFEVVGDGGAITELVLTRVVPASGRSRAYVDGRPATVGRLAELTSDLVDLHGQHAHQSLLSAATQRDALDRFAGTDLQALRAARAAVIEIDAELAALGGDERARAREIDLLRYQVQELAEAAIVGPDEDTRLAAEESLLANAVAHREAADTALRCLADDNSADELIGAGLRALADRPPFDDIANRLNGVSAELADITASLRQLVDSIDDDPQRLDQIRERRQLLADLRRKYGADLSDVIDFFTDATERLAELERYDERAARLDARRGAAIDSMHEAARAVGKLRRRAADRLATAVTEHLRHLALPDAQVAVAFADDPDDLAAERVNLLFAANPGMPILPLNRVASGGELARAMLALRLVLVDHAQPRAGTARTLVFDEVDAGIGGAAATKVGRALAQLGESFQVVVVTHLAQVAAQAHVQVSVEKSSTDTTTTTDVVELAPRERVAELARMLSGEVTPEALSHARTMLAGSSST